MSSKTVFEQIRAVLTADADGKTYNVQLDVTVRVMYANERTMPVARALVETALSPMSGKVVPDGIYTLTYTFDGTEKKEKVKIGGGGMMAA